MFLSCGFTMALETNILNVRVGLSCFSMENGTRRFLCGCFFGKTMQQINKGTKEIDDNWGLYSNIIG